MNVSLTPQLENFVNAKVESGRYNSASEVVREGLRLLKDRDDRQLRADVQAGFDAVDRGEYTDYTATSIKSLAIQVKAGRQLLASTKKSRAR